MIPLFFAIVLLSAIAMVIFLFEVIMRGPRKPDDP